MLMFSSIIATYFLVQGIWMILPFTIIELTALGIALLIYARHALDYESIAIDGSSVTVEKNIGGKLERHEFNTKWLQLKQEEDGKRLIRIEQSDQELPIGIFVPVDARAQFFKDLRQQICCES
jgi:uncharacterized membrane protein